MIPAILRLRYCFVEKLISLLGNLWLLNIGLYGRGPSIIILLLYLLFLPFSRSYLCSVPELLQDAILASTGCIFVFEVAG